MTAAPSDLNPAAAYRFGSASPGRPPGLGRPGQIRPAQPFFLFFFSLLNLNTENVLSFKSF
jgi:hypothetical protein